LVAAVINKCNERKKYIGICGQAPSDYQEFAEFVVECGIQTMSLNPDTVVKTKLAIAELEHKLARHKTKFNPGFEIKSYHRTQPKAAAKKKTSVKKVAAAAKKIEKKIVKEVKKVEKKVEAKLTKKPVAKKAPVKKRL
jgi:hypothetical protein